MRRHDTNMMYIYRGGDCGGDGDGEVAAELGVGEEAADEGEQVERAHEVGHHGGGLGVGEVQLADEVRHQVHRDAHHAHTLRQLRAQDQPGAQPASGPRLVRRVAPEVHGLPVVAAAVPTMTRTGNLHTYVYTPSELSPPCIRQRARGCAALTICCALLWLQLAVCLARTVQGVHARRGD